MKRRQFTAGIACAAAWPLLGASGVAQAAVAQADAAAGIRAALTRGAESAVGLLGAPDGFLGNPKVRIPLPGVLKNAAKLLKATGQQQRLDDLETAMNRAAEAAVPEARDLLVAAVRNMSVADAKQVITGGDDAATQFFARQTRTPLGAKFLPIVTKATERVALADKYNAVAGKAAGLGLIKGKDANIQQYVTERALDGLFAMIGEEERRIRQDPVGTGSAILKKVFGGLK
jgi:hypothetical protein